MTAVATPLPLVASATGVLDASVADRLEAELLALSLSGREIVLDLADVTLLDSAALAVVLDIARVCRRRGGRLVLREPSGIVADIVRVATVEDRLLTIEPRSS